MNENTPTTPPTPDPDERPTEVVDTSVPTPEPAAATSQPADQAEPGGGQPQTPGAVTPPLASPGQAYPDQAGTGQGGPDQAGTNRAYPAGAPTGAQGSGYPPPGYPPPGYPPPSSGYPPPGYPPGAYPPPSYGPQPGPSPTSATTGYPPVRRLTRSRTDRMVGGVCGGLARYWNTDPVLLRILTVVLTLVTGGAFLVGYIIAWIAIPDEPMSPSPFGQDPRADQVGYAAGGNPPYADRTAAVPAPPRERSYLGWLVVSAVILVAGVLALIGIFVEPSIQFWGVLFASILALLGVGLLVGARYGRARWLVILAVPMAFLTFGTVAAGNWVQDNPRWDRWSTGGGSLSVGDRVWKVTPALAASSPLEYRLSAGEALLDLTALSGPAGTGDARTLEIEAGVGLGQLVVVIPDDIELELDASVDVGQITVGDIPTTEGTNLDVDTTIEPLAGEEPTWIVTLDAAIGAGNLEVRREAA